MQRNYSSISECSNKTNGSIKNEKSKYSIKRDGKRNIFSYASDLTISTSLWRVEYYIKKKNSRYTSNIFDPSVSAQEVLSFTHSFVSCGLLLYFNNIAL